MIFASAKDQLGAHRDCPNLYSLLPRITAPSCIPALSISPSPLMRVVRSSQIMSWRKTAAMIGVGGHAGLSTLSDAAKVWPSLPSTYLYLFKSATKFRPTQLSRRRTPDRCLRGAHFHQLLLLKASAGLASLTQWQLSACEVLTVQDASILRTACCNTV